MSVKQQAIPQQKKTMRNGFDDSGIRMNIWIARKKKWTLAELEERSSYLTDRALAIWQLPATDFQPEEKRMARFHAKWGKKFYDVIVPYITGA